MKRSRVVTPRATHKREGLQRASNSWRDEVMPRKRGSPDTETHRRMGTAAAMASAFAGSPSTVWTNTRSSSQSSVCPLRRNGQQFRGRGRLGPHVRFPSAGRKRAAFERGDGNDAVPHIRPRCEMSDNASPGLDIWSPEQEATMHVVCASITAGADVLFPGGSQVLHVRDDEALADTLSAVSAEDPPHFAWLPVDAWGAPATVGTTAVIDDLRIDRNPMEVSLLCSGLCRFRVLELAPDRQTARVKFFYDDVQPTEDAPEVSEGLPESATETDEAGSGAETPVMTMDELETALVQTMKDIVRLSIKTLNPENPERQDALQETMKRVEAFWSKVEDVDSEESAADTMNDAAGLMTEGRLLHHWVGAADKHRRRELLSFVLLDLLNLPFMHRRELLTTTNTRKRMQQALDALDPYVKELAAKSAIASSFGGSSDDSSSA